MVRHLQCSNLIDLTYGLARIERPRTAGAGAVRQGDEHVLGAEVLDESHRRRLCVSRCRDGNDCGSLEQMHIVYVGRDDREKSMAGDSLP